MSNDGRSSNQTSTSVGAARNRFLISVKYGAPVLAAILAAIFRDSIISNLQNISSITYGFVGIGIAGVLYLLIPLSWDIENLKSDVESIKSDSRSVRKKVRELESTGDEDENEPGSEEEVRTDGGRNLFNLKYWNFEYWAGVFAGAIAGASIGLIGGIEGALVGSLFGGSIGYYIAVQIQERESKKEAIYQWKKVRDFKVALVTGGNEVFVVNGERDAIVRPDTSFTAAYIPLEYPWSEEVEIIGMDLMSSVSEERQMGPEIIYYGSYTLTDPETGREVEIEFDFREYPTGSFDIFELQIYGRADAGEIQNLEERVSEIVS